MRVAPICAPICALICAQLLATSAGADSFRITLGGTVLGTLAYSENGSGSTLRTTLDNTPLGVFNGTFAATSSATAQGAEFNSDSQSSRKSRQIAFATAQGHVTTVSVIPGHERTALSDPEQVPPGVTDPVRTIGHLLRASGCPAPIRFYDGRRVIAITPQGSSGSPGALACTMSYRVTHGPGHLSPLRIARATLELHYATGSSGQSLQRIRLSAGVFTVTLDRTG